MISRSFSFISILILFACHPDKTKEVALDNLQFHTTDQSEIYFKNIRRSYYDLEEIPDAAIEIFRLSDYQKVTSPFIKPIITFNWRNDFAAIMLEQSPELLEEQSITIIFENGEEQDKALINFDNVRTQSTIAVRIYNAILKNDQIYLLLNKQKQPLFTTSEEIEYFRITVFDFLRLVEIR